MNEETIFHLASQKAGADRTAFLDETCVQNPELRRRVEALLEAHDDPAGFMQSPPIERPANLEGPGGRIGQYKLLQQIGEGGMGIVYMAEQTHPVQRKVALKIIKAGMDSRQVIARFEAERQALALMDHPNIAKVLDAGTTDSGRPFFVMELVKGIPITEYCDKHRLSPKERLELFISVCQAVQHAHQKGIIHRDLKPSNVLVAQYDGKPLPKVIDFGVAKATGPKLTDRTLFTEFGAIVGTLEYMSPEEAGLDQLDIDTRSDIYSLGVLFYELLTGTTPLERWRIKEAAILELLRLVREEEPPRPSTRLSRLEQAPTISANRGLEPRKLCRLIEGELDWIAMKALEKDRARRYETASAFAQDVERHLQDEPISARAASTGYWLRKFIRRHRLAVAASAGILTVLVFGVAGTTIGMLRAIKATAAEGKQRTEAELARSEAEEVNRFMLEMFASADPANARGEQVLVRDVLDRAAENLDRGFMRQHPRTEAAIRSTLGQTYAAIGIYPAAEAQLSAALESRRKLLGDEHPDVAGAMNSLGQLLQKRNETARAEAMHKGALAIRRKLLARDDPAVAESLNNLGQVLFGKRDYTAAEPLFAEALAIQQKAFGPEHPAVARTLSSMAQLRWAKQDLAGAESLLRQALAINRKHFGNLHPEVFTSINSLGLLLFNRGDSIEAEALYREALGMGRKVLGEEHPEMASTLNNFAQLLSKSDPAGADQLYRQALLLQRKLLGDEHLEVATTLHNLARLMLYKAGRLDPPGNPSEPVRLLKEALSIRLKQLGDVHLKVAQTQGDLALALERRGDLTEAEVVYHRALDNYRKTVGEDTQEVAWTMRSLAAVLRKNGILAEADSLERQANLLSQKLQEKDTLAKRLSPPTNEQRDALYTEAHRRLRESMVFRADRGGESQVWSNRLISWDYWQPGRNLVHGTLWGWGGGRRPDALIAVELELAADGKHTLIYKFISLADGPLRARAGDWTWQPQERGVELKLMGGVRPLNSIAGREQQFDRLTTRFKAFETFAGQAAPLTLRGPHYHYGEPPGPPLEQGRDETLVDGYIYFFSKDMEPQAALILEARQLPIQGLTLFYGLVSLSSTGVTVIVDDRELWEQPPRRTTTARDTFWISPPQPVTITMKKEPTTRPRPAK